jgi:acyl carrier protein
MTDTTTTPPDLFATIVAALGEVLKRDTSAVTGETRLFDELGLDSTSVLELLLELEGELGIEFDADTLEQGHFATVDTLTAYLQSEMGS